MELRHLRFFVAVAEEGSLSVAAERRLHTAQPSLSRQMRDLEYQVGVPLMTRSARGIELTASGHAFLEHARSCWLRQKRPCKWRNGRRSPPKPHSRWASSPDRRWIGCLKP